MVFANTLADSKPVWGFAAFVAFLALISLLTRNRTPPRV